MAKQKFSFDKSLAEVQSIVEELNSGDISIDVLQEKVVKANQLLAKCKEKLRSTEEEIGKVLG